MADDGKSKSLGIYWGKKSLYLAESIGFDTKTSANIPFSMKADGSDFSPFSSEGGDLVSNLMSTFKEKKLKPASIYLSLPTKEIIFRSFIIPWMQQNEIADVVEFEASKYIPFSLEELSYAFHHMNITEGNTKRIRIIFAAIKKTTLDTFTALLEQANVSITNVEPAPVSLIRFLLAQNLIENDKTLALVEKDGVIGKITIVDQGIPLFVREFQMQVAGTPTETEEAPDSQAILTRLMNEIRISLDYFNRQESQLEVESLTLITDPAEAPELRTKIETDLQIPTNDVDLTNFLNDSENKSIEHLCALGASFHDSVPDHPKFDLVENFTQSDPQKFDIKNIDLKSINLKPIILTASVCAGILVGLFFLKGFMLGKVNEQVVSLESQLGIHRAKTADMLETKTAGTQKRLARYKSIRTEGHITQLLEEIPEALPQSAWLKELQLSYGRHKNAADKIDTTSPDYVPVINISLGGYVYTENLNEHISIITDFARNLESTELVAKIFKRIRVESATQQKLGKHMVTFFRLDFVRE